MSNQYSQNNDIPSMVEQQQQPQTAPVLAPPQEHSQYLKDLHTQAKILHHELSERLTFLGDYIDHAQCLIDFHFNQADSNPEPWERVISPAQTLLHNVLDLAHSAEILAGLPLQREFEDWQKLDSLALTIGEFVGRTDWMYLGRDFREVRAWASDAGKVLGVGKRAIVWVEETICKVEAQAGSGVIVVRSVS